jgi:predicted glycoside hydrolase/deacetylase ChbG (UPF0249 family)
MAGEKRLIVNADDFGLSTGVNRGIVECHARGIVTSTSLLVTGGAASEAALLSRKHPRLAVGLHWDVSGEDEREFDLDDAGAVREELRRQLAEFQRLLGRPPTHVDSHHHVHLDERVLPLLLELVQPLGIPVRGNGRIRCVGGFYAQWEWQVTNLVYVSVEFLQRLLRDEVSEGWTELSCHPGYVSTEVRTVYSEEREAEVRTLTDPRVRQTVDELGIRLVSFVDFRRSRFRYRCGTKTYGFPR